MDEVRTRLPICDWVAIGIAVGYICVLAFLPSAGVDLKLSYLPTVYGDFHGFYNPYWIRPLFEMLALLPFRLAYVFLMLLSLVGIWFSTRVFEGRLIHVLLTYQFAFLLFYGQIDALVVWGLAISWWGLNHRRYFVLGVGMVLALLKPQVTVVAVGLILWWAGSHKARVKSLLPFAFVIALSIWRYGWWFSPWWQHLQNNSLNRGGSITLWEYFGPIVLLLWLPLAFVRLPRRDFLALALATSALTMPYYQQYSLVVLQVFPIGWVAWLGNVGFLFYKFHYLALEWTIVVPAVVYLRFLMDSLDWQKT